MAGTRKLDISTLGESSDQACLDNIWQELTETPELIDALNMIGDPQSFKSAFEDAALAHKETTGSFPSSRTATIVTLDKSGDSFGESAESGRDCLFDLSITCRHQSVLLTTDDDDQMPERLCKLGFSLLKRGEAQEAITDIDYAIECSARAVQLYQAPDLRRMNMLEMLSNAHHTRFNHYQELHSLDSAIAYQKQAVLILGGKFEVNPFLLFGLGSYYAQRFKYFGGLSDLEEAIQHQACALNVTLDENPNKLDMLNDFSISHAYRFLRLGKLEDIQKSIDLQCQAVSSVPDGHGRQPEMLDNLGRSYLCRYDRLGELVDLNQAIKCFSQAAILISDGHQRKPQILLALAASHHRRFSRLGQITDIEREIQCYSQASLFIPVGDPDKAAVLSNLGDSHQVRFEHLGDPTDIELALRYKSQALFITPENHLNRPEMLSSAANSYWCRSKHLGQAVDLDQAIELTSQAVSLTPDGHPSKSGRLSNLGISYSERFKQLGELVDLERAAQCFSQALSFITDQHSDDKPAILSNLSQSYLSQFRRQGKLEDVDQAITHIADAASLIPNEHPRKVGMLINLGESYRCRFDHLGELADIDQSIASLSQAVLLAPDGYPEKTLILANLGSSHLGRFEHLGKLADINQAIEWNSQAVLHTPEGHSKKGEMLNGLGIAHLRRFETFSHLEDIDQAIECLSHAVLISPERNSGKYGWLHNLGTSYRSRFRELGKLVDIDRAITYFSQAILLAPDNYPDKPTTLMYLGNSHWHRFKDLGELKDVKQAISYLQTAAQYPTGRSFARFTASREWAKIAFSSEDSSCILAYRQAMELVSEVVWIGSTLSRRYDYIHSIDDVSVEAAAVAISAREYTLALEWLESGRSIVWNQTLQLRTQFDNLAKVTPELAESLKQVAQQLEITSQRAELSGNWGPLGNQPIISDSQSLESIGQRHRRLAELYEEKLVQVRKITGFSDFLKPKKAADLMPVTQSGPVVVINVHSIRCDALILRPNEDNITHVPLPELSDDEVTRLQSHIQGSLESTRNRGRAPLFWDQPSYEFEGILAALWHKIVNPVLMTLGYIQNPPVEPLPHITWCTTGALSFLPIHAAGCYGEAGPKIFDFVVSSYTPTLSALLSTKPGPLAMKKILAVSQEKALPNTKDELAHIQRHAKPFQYISLENDQATPQAVLKDMEECDCVHIACHGLQKLDKPTQSYFALHNGNLTLAEITKKPLENKGLAFLSACQTATGDVNMPDEAIHLAAGMLVAGYPTVIATMWSIEDKDAPLVADKVYGELLKDGRLDGARVARALHAAIKELRKDIGEEKFHRWVPYIHLGV